MPTTSALSTGPGWKHPEVDLVTVDRHSTLNRFLPASTDWYGNPVGLWTNPPSIPAVLSAPKAQEP